tara:strand:- start:315 stop:701 length:387 start_codon:yes stop_codon:yes gene_type:complete
MSTRATYQFIPADQTFRPIITLYIHHDGYPAGAAEYLSGVETPEQFIRRNRQAEITDSHDTHEDTEYRYTIYEGSGLMQAQKRDFPLSVNLPAVSVRIGTIQRRNPVLWETIFEGKITQFTTEEKQNA